MGATYGEYLPGEEAGYTTARSVIYNLDMFEGSFFITLLLLVLITLMIAIILHILILLKYANRIRKKVAQYFIIPSVFSCIILIFFVVGFPTIFNLNNGFIGSSEYPHTPSGNIESIARDWWGPSIGWFIFLIVFVIYLVLTILHFKSLREEKEEVIESKVEI